MDKISFQDFVDEPSTIQEAPAPDLDLTTEVDVDLAVRRLPPLPAVLQEVLMDLRNVDADIGKLEERISSDPSLTTRVLKMANSPFYNSRSEVVSVGRAVMTLGFKTVSNLILATSFRGAMATNRAIPGYERNGIFHHSLAVGLASTRLTRHVSSLRGYEDETFVAGLLHDVGRIALANVYQEHAEAFGPGGDPLSLENERKVLGIDHQDVGAKVISHWGLPDELLCPVTRHHDDPESLVDEPVTLAVQFVDRWLNHESYARTSPRKCNALADDAARLGTEPEIVATALEGLADEVTTFLGGGE